MCILVEYRHLNRWKSNISYVKYILLSLEYCVMCFQNLVIAITKRCYRYLADASNVVHKLILNKLEINRIKFWNWKRHTLNTPRIGPLIKIFLMWTMSLINLILAVNSFEETEEDIIVALCLHIFLMLIDVISLMSLNDEWFRSTTNAILRWWWCDDFIRSRIVWLCHCWLSLIQIISHSQPND